MLRCEPALFKPVASAPTAFRLIDTLAASGGKALQAIRSARSEVRDRVRLLAGENAPETDGQVVVDLDGVLVIARSDKEDAAATWKKTYGRHPLTAFVDHGAGGPVAVLLRPGNAGSNTAADHITTAQLALTQLPKRYRRGRQTLIRADSAGGTHDFVSWLAGRGRRLSRSVGMTVTEVIHEHVPKVPAPAWTAVAEADGEARDGAWVAELTGKLLDGCPKGMRLTVRRERPHSGARLRITDADGMRITCFVTNTTGRPIAELELRHRLRARAENRIRAAPGHRPAQPAPPHHSPAQDLARDRPDRPRPAGLDAHARAHRQGQALEAPPPAAPPVHHGRTTRHQTRSEPCALRVHRRLLQPRRIQRRLGYLSPIEYEEKHYTNQAPTGQVSLKPHQTALTG